MSVLSFSDVRQSMAAALTALPGWRQSAWNLDRFGKDPEQVQHHAFVVAAVASQPHQNPGRRQPAEGLATISQVQVRFAHRLTVDSQVAAYDAALDAESQAITAVLTTSDRTSLHLLWEGSSRASLGEGWVITTITFSAVHRI